MRDLSAAGVPVRVLVAPVVPGLTDFEMPAILEAARDAGARAAGYTMLRLPLTVAPVFLEWLGRTFPDRVGRVEGRVRDARGGRLNDSAFERRMCGTGEYAKAIGRMFDVFARRYGLDGDLRAYDCSRFQPPDANGRGGCSDRRRLLPNGPPAVVNGYPPVAAAHRYTLGAPAACGCLRR